MEFKAGVYGTFPLEREKLKLYSILTDEIEFPYKAEFPGILGVTSASISVVITASTLGLTLNLNIRSYGQLSVTGTGSGSEVEKILTEFLENDAPGLTTESRGFYKGLLTGWQDVHAHGMFNFLNWAPVEDKREFVDDLHKYMLGQVENYKYPDLDELTKDRQF